MNNRTIVKRINEYIYTASQELCVWLSEMLPQTSPDWWQDCVIANLSPAQKKLAEEKGYTELSQFDLAALLRITMKSWFAMRSAFAYLSFPMRDYVRSMMQVRNNWAHCAGGMFKKEVVIHDVTVIQNFLDVVIGAKQYNAELDEFKNAIENSDFSSVDIHTEISQPVQPIVLKEDSSDIKERDMVYLVSEPDTKGMVFSVSDVGGTKVYDVFVNGNILRFYDGQIGKVESKPAYNWIDLDSFMCNLAAHEINNPSAENLYSLNAARIDFEPYQFRPALKMIKADEPRILIADSVGVGKTIETGLIIKELDARRELGNVLIVCPKPLVAEHKWQREMRRFDEDFEELDGAALQQVISDVHRDGGWPEKYNKVIVPYSILDRKTYQGDEAKRGRVYGLLDLDPPPHFDLVVVDEAHHIRNGSLEKEKAFEYKCVHYFCKHAKAVVFLTATPLQTSDDDLYTLLNLLRPDVVMDKDVFMLMTKPNEYINKCSTIVRGAAKGWQKLASDEFRKVVKTRWGENVIAKNPRYSDILRRMEQEEVSREERVKLISDIELLNSFSTMLNRTRRKDIKDFCVRRPFTVEIPFTDVQEKLHNELLAFESVALSVLHNARSVSFMMSTIRRQSASCIFGLAPHIKDIVNRRFGQLMDDPEVDVTELELREGDASILTKLAQKVIGLAERLPEEDPKFDSIVEIIEEKNKCENNKIIIFSTFRHTLDYLYKKLNALHYRVAKIDGSMHDAARKELTTRFKLDRDNEEALDILLFTEVGSEGLDYQFCNMMINYDLPWNPMRIEQRIGRIDRRGQQSEDVTIYNIITPGTVDADIYDRCLRRIGVFERSVGECEEVLGDIGREVERIAVNAGLSEEQRRAKLEQMANNKIRHMQELSQLEDEQKSLFGFNLSNYTAVNEVKKAESLWLSPQNIQHLVELYLNARLGEGQYIIGNSSLKQLRLGMEAREDLLKDFRKLTQIRSKLKREWENYLKGSNPYHTITFHSETATEETKAFFITPMHPLVKQAALYFKSTERSHIYLEYISDSLPVGRHPFAIHAWDYVGIQHSFKVVPICLHDELSSELLDIIQDAYAPAQPPRVAPNTWDSLESVHISCWREEKIKHVAHIEQLVNYKKEVIASNYHNRVSNLDRKLEETGEDRIRRMYHSERDFAREAYLVKMKELDERLARADIHTDLITLGIIDIKRG